MHRISTRPVRRAAPKAAGAIASVIAGLAKKTRYADPALLEHWPAIAGEDIAALCRPGRITGAPGRRVLSLIAPSGAAAAELQMRLDELKTRINRYYGRDTITSLGIRQAPAPAQDTKRKFAGNTGTGPLEKSLASFRAAVKRRNDVD